MKYWCELLITSIYMPRASIRTALCLCYAPLPPDMVSSGLRYQVGQGLNCQGEHGSGWGSKLS